MQSRIYRICFSLTKNALGALDFGGAAIVSALDTAGKALCDARCGVLDAVREPIKVMPRTMAARDTRVVEGELV